MTQPSQFAQPAVSFRQACTALLHDLSAHDWHAVAPPVPEPPPVPVAPPAEEALDEAPPEPPVAPEDEDEVDVACPPPEDVVPEAARPLDADDFDARLDAAPPPPLELELLEVPPSG